MTESEPPSGWASARLDEIAEVRLGRQRSPKNHTGDQMRPYLRAANLTWGGIDVSDVKQMNFEDAEVTTYRLHDGDVLLSEASGSASEVGKPGVWRGQLDGDICFQNTLLRVRPEAGIDSDFLYLRLLFECLRGGFANDSRGVGIHHLGSSKLAALAVAFPATITQQQIAETLGSILGQLARLEQDIRKIAARIRATADALTRRTCVGDKPMDVPGGLPPLPAGWTWTTLGDIAEIAGGVTKDSKKDAEEGLIEVPYLRVANVQRGRLDLAQVSTIRVTPKKLDALRLEPGDVLMNEGGDRDKLGRGWVWSGEIENCIHQNHVFRVRVKDEALHPKLLSWYGNTYGRQWFESVGKQTTNLASISMTNLKRLPVPVPPLEDQAQLVARHEERLTLLNAATEALDALLKRCVVLRRTAIHHAMSGELVPAAMSDESAHVLLKQIEAERDTRRPAARPRNPGTVRRARTSRAETVEEPA